MSNIDDKTMFGAGVALALAIGSRQANADVIFVESFEGALQSETSIIHGGIHREGDFWAVLPNGSAAIGKPSLSIISVLQAIRLSSHADQDRKQKARELRFRNPPPSPCSVSAPPDSGSCGGGGLHGHRHSPRSRCCTYENGGLWVAVFVCGSFGDALGICRFAAANGDLGEDSGRDASAPSVLFRRTAPPSGVDYFYSFSDCRIG